MLSKLASEFVPYVVGLESIFIEFSEISFSLVKVIIVQAVVHCYVSAFGSFELLLAEDFYKCLLIAEL